jgi:threonine aldolase
VNQIEFRSDNSAGAAPEILAAIETANAGTAIAYGSDPVTARLQEVVREVFEHPTARVFPVTSGTAANALALTALCPPWGAVLCHETAHILNSEAGATSMLGAGAQMHGVPGDDFLMSADAVRDALASTRWGDPHHSQPTVISFTQPSDMGTVYSVDEIAELTAITGGHGLRAHLDGARIANALVRLNCSPADMTWRAGIDAVSLGATKNGGLSAEAIVVFDDDAAEELVYRTKRSGHVTSKMRFQSAQVIAYLTDDLWLHLARNSNDRMADLAAGLGALGERGVELVNRPDVNMLFVRLADEQISRLEQAGLLFYTLGPGLIRLVTNWATTSEEIDRTLEIFAGL